MSLSLSKEERERFAAWLENEAKTDRAIAEQAEKLGNIAGKLLAKRNREEAEASETIARKLRATKDF